MAPPRVAPQGVSADTTHGLLTGQESRATISASSQLRQINDPAARLLAAVQRYTDDLYVAAGRLVGSRTLAELDRVEKFHLT